MYVEEASEYKYFHADDFPNLSYLKVYIAINAAKRLQTKKKCFVAFEISCLKKSKFCILQLLFEYEF